MTSNFTLVDGLGLELRLFILTHQKRSEANVDLRGLQYIRKDIKETPIHHLQSWIHGGQVDPDTFQRLKVIKDIPIHHHQSRIIEGQVVPGTPYKCRICPGYAMYQISVSGLSGVISRALQMNLELWAVGRVGGLLVVVCSLLILVSSLVLLIQIGHWTLV